MTIDALATWQSTFAAIPKVATTAWANNIANWVDARVTGKMSLPGIGGPGFSFTYNKATFAAQLLSLAPTTNALAGITAFADAWLTAMNASTLATAPGSFIGTSTPATLWASVSSTIFVPASLTLGRAKILELATAPAVSDPLLSDFPIKFRAAFLLLTVTTTGVNSVPPPGGPNPLIDVARPVG